MKRMLSLLLAVVIIFTMAGTHVTLTAEAAENARGAGTAELTAEEGDGGDDPDGFYDPDGEDDPDGVYDPDGGDDPDDGVYDPGQGDLGPTATVSDLRLAYDEEKDTITLSYSFDSDCAYVRIYANEKVEEEKYTGKVYDFEDAQQGVTYEFRVVAYNFYDRAGTEVTGTYEVPYKKASVTNVDADYNLEKGVLVIDWDASNVATADIYQDGVLLASGVTDDIYMTQIKLEALSKHTYRVVPYNKAGEEGTAGTFELTVDDYVACVDWLSAEYDENTKLITVKWETTYTQYVTVSLNGEDLVTNYTAGEYSFSYSLQPGATYIVEVTPYNYRNEEGEMSEDDISVGDFDVPEDLTVKRTSESIRDKSGNYTGFAKPVISVKWEAQKDAVYEIYRAQKDKMGAYSWIATVVGDKEGIYEYRDSKIGIGTYYYKVRRKIVEDDFIEQELYTALSEAEGVSTGIPKAKLKAVLAPDGQIHLSMSADRAYITGYEIYRREGSGSYKKLAVITGNEYTDTDIEFGVSYYYRVKAYYYDESSKKKSRGGYSKVSKVKNTVGEMKAEAVAVSSSKIKLTWTPAANAEGYEVYCKSGVSGDSYASYTATDKLMLTHRVSGGGTYTFLIKAYRTSAKGKLYFSSAEVSCKMGFSAPSGFAVSKTVYERDKKTGALMQKSRLTWNRVYGASGYYIDVYNAKTKKYTRLAKIKKGSSTSYTLSNPVTEGAETLRYRISAYAGGSVKRGGTVEITPQLGAPGKVKAVTSGSKVKISWKKVSEAECYRVYRSNGRNRILIGETAKTSLTDKGLIDGVAYTYYVQAVNLTLKLTGELSEPAAYQVLPADVTKLAADNSEPATVQLTWKAAKNAEYYYIYCRTSDEENYRKVAKVSGKETSYLHTKRVAGTTCYYKVTAVQNVGGDAEAESAGKTLKITVVR